MNFTITLTPPPKDREIDGWKWYVYAGPMYAEQGVAPSRERALADIAAAVSEMCSESLPGGE